MPNRLSLQVKLKRGYTWLVEIIYLLGQYLTIRYVHERGPGRIALWIFGVPRTLYRIGLAGLLSNKILLLTTIGRRSGKKHSVSLGYIAGIEKRTCYVIAGWRGQTDWLQNLQVNPNVEVQIGSDHFECHAQFLSLEEQIEVLSNFSRQFPLVLGNYERMTGQLREDREALFRMVAGEGAMILLQDRGGNSSP